MKLQCLQKVSCKKPGCDKARFSSLVKINNLPWSLPTGGTRVPLATIIACTVVITAWPVVICPVAAEQ